jgi:hypothetical protein
MMCELPPRLNELPVPAEPAGGVCLHGASWARRGPPVHPWAALLLLVVDNLWNLADWMALSWVLSIPLSFAMVFVPCLVIQKVVRGDGWGRALALSLVLGVVAAIPTSVTGTPVGLALLAWFGIDRLVGGPLGR